MGKNKEVKYGCYVEDEVIDNCVMDENVFTIDDCANAKILYLAGRPKEDCEHR